MPWRERWLLLHALLVLPLLTLALRLCGFRRLYGALARLACAPSPAATDGTVHLAPARATARAVQSAAWYSPLSSTCLIRSLALWWLLRRQGIAGELRIGVAKEAAQLQAHAWVEHRGSVLNDTDDVRQRFAAFDLDSVPPGVWRRRDTWKTRR
jgi:hypothetical protein